MKHDWKVGDFFEFSTKYGEMAQIIHEFVYNDSRYVVVKFEDGETYEWVYGRLDGEFGEENKCFYLKPDEVVQRKFES